MIAYNNHISKDNVLSLASQDDILSFYLGIDVKSYLAYKKSKSFHSPLREDKHPSCTISYFKGRLFFHDWSMGIHWDCFDLVMNLYSCGFYEALEYINRDLNLGLGSQLNKGDYFKMAKKKLRVSLQEQEKIALAQKSRSVVQIKSQDFTQVDLEYWSKYGLSYDDLIFWQVYSAKVVFIDENPILYYSSLQPQYGYLFPSGRMKIYRPMSEGTKWMGNSTQDDIQGWAQMQGTDQLVITKSMKDAMVISKYGIDSIAPNSENSDIDDNKISQIKSLYDDENVKILYDHDAAGVKGADKLSAKTGFKTVYMPDNTSKDISDFRSEYGEIKTGKLLKQLTA